MIYCYRRAWDDEGYKDIEDSKKDRMAKQSYDATEEGLKYEDSVGEMSQDIINKGKKSFKSGYKKAIITLKKGQSIDLTTGI
mgnify:CR=1 FL=1